MLKINHQIFIRDSDIQFSFIRASGPGGQNVNKVASAVLLRFNIDTLPEDVRARLKNIANKKINFQNELIIKAMSHRTQERNKQDALYRLQELIKRAAIPPKQRHKTKPTRASKEKRLQKKKHHAKIKSLRHKQINHEH